MAGLRAERLTTFTAWAARHVQGDEKGEAQIFLDRGFQGFDQPGCLDVGGTPAALAAKGQSPRACFGAGRRSGCSPAEPYPPPGRQALSLILNGCQYID